MKTCPSCRRMYEDESLNFCLEDGSTLVQETGGGPLPQTVFVSDSPAADQDGPYSGAGRFVPPGHQPPHPVLPEKKSRTWFWAVGVLSLAILLCGGGFAALLLMAGLSQNSAGTLPDSPAVDGRINVKTFDMTNWPREVNEFSRSDFRKGAFVLETLKPEYFYVYVTLADFQTQNATARLTVKNLNAKETNYGYGIIFHSTQTPLVKGYAFLIDSEKQSFRVVKHLLSQEFDVQSWKYFPHIKKGSSENVLEIRDEGDMIKCFVNGQLATSVTEDFEDDEGIAGVYASNAPIAFTRLEIRK